MTTPRALSDDDDCDLPLSIIDHISFLKSAFKQFAFNQAADKELSTLRQLCDELALRLSETDSLLQTYAPHSSTQFKFNGEALSKYNSTKGNEG